MARSAWVFVTQSVSSASNFVLTFFVIASATRKEFGGFSVCMTSYMLVAQLTRTGLSLPLLVIYSGKDPDEVSAASRPALGLALLIGSGGAVLLAAGGMVYQEAQSAFFVVALTLPMLIYQDVVRHVAIARGQPQVAAASDGLWLILQVAGSIVVVVLSRQSPTVLLLVWATAGIVSGIVFGWRLKAYPSMSGITAWLQSHRSLLGRMLSEFGLNSGSLYALSYGLAVLAGTEELGRLRAAQALIGPVSVLVLGGVVLGVPESVRVRHDKAALRRFALRLAAFLATASILGGLASYALLPFFGPSLFPAIWSFARPLLPVLTVYSAAVGISIGALSALRALGESRWIVRARIYTAGLVLGVGLPLAEIAGALGAVAVLSLIEIGFAVCAWSHFARVPTDTHGDAVEDSRIVDPSTALNILHPSVDLPPEGV